MMCFRVRKKWALFVAFGVALLPFSFETGASASQSVYQAPHSFENHDLGLGLMLGVPTGITLKYWLSDSNALNFGLSYAFGSYFALIGDYLWHFRSAFRSTKLERKGHQLIPYVGLGAVFFVASRDESPFYFKGSPYAIPIENGGSALGVRVPLGMEFFPRGAPVGIFAELDPGMTLLSSIVGFVQGVIGARYYF